MAFPCEQTQKPQNLGLWGRVQTTWKYGGGGCLNDHNTKYQISSFRESRVGVNTQKSLNLKNFDVICERPYNPKFPNFPNHKVSIGIGTVL